MTSIRELRSNVDALRKFMHDATKDGMTSKQAELLGQLDRLAADLGEQRMFSTTERDDYAKMLETITDRLTK